jgi:c-di-AMP phosphodiesterase-like protein
MQNFIRYEKVGGSLDSQFYSGYKNKFMIGMGVLILLTFATLAKYNIMLGVSGAMVALVGVSGYAWLNQVEWKAREKEIRLELGGDQPPEHDNADGVAVDGLTALVLLQVDDYDEVFQGLPDEQRPLLVSEVDKFLREWALGNVAYLRKGGRDHYLALLPAERLADMEDEGFAALGKIREINVGKHLPVTLSAGMGKGDGSTNNLALLGQLAQEGLDMALSRGGDQVIVKSPDHTWFYGGHSEAVGKRAQVRARVTAIELERLFKSCKSVMIMGHTGIDFDAFGAAIGMVEIARHYGKEVHIAVDHPGGAVERLFSMVSEHDPELLIDSQDAAQGVSSQTLLLLMDVHRPKMVPNTTLLSRAGYIGVIDHHRRGDQFLERSNLIYIEPSASSTCELVGELIRYFPQEITVSPLAATALLAGLIVDTKKFTFATSPQTFRVAALLRDEGAHPGVIRELFTDSLDVMLYRVQMMQGVEIVLDRFAIVQSLRPFAEAQVAASRAADTILEIQGVAASFALYPIADGIGVSARSVGTVNVHRVMERMGGGGHFTVAGAKLAGADLKSVRSQLMEILESEQEEEQ